MSGDGGPYYIEDTDLVSDDPDFDLTISMILLPDFPTLLLMLICMDPSTCLPNFIYAQLSTDEQHSWNQIRQCSLLVVAQPFLAF